MANAPTVVKVSGHELDDGAFVARLGELLAQVARPTVLVHGGGKELSAAFERYGVVPRFVDGLRVTDPATMPVVEMVLSGAINKRLVAALLARGVRAIGLSGVDLGVLRARPYRPGGHDLGRVGEVTAVDGDALQVMLAQGWLPVLSPVSLGDDGQPYNVNADMVAQAVAQALGADELVFVSNVKGVLRDGAVVGRLTAPQIEYAIAVGTISGGMVPKVRAALDALDAGVGRVRICDLAGMLHGGTQIVHG
jgi:acetylglutamate kinase